MSRGKRKNKKKQDLQGLLLIFIAVIVVLSVGFAYFQSKSNEITRDKNTLCRNDGLVTVEHVIIIDSTDSFNKTQALMAKKELNSLLDNSSQESRFSLYVINKNIADEKPLLELCNPGDGSDKNEFTSNKRRLLQKWKEGFHNKIINEIDLLIDANIADSSPIMETVKYASVNSFYGSKAQKKKLILLSDLLQHSSSYSHYQENGNYDDFKSLNIANSLTPSLDNVDVEILYLYRTKDSNRQNRKHITFWEHYLTSGGGSLTRVKKLN